MALARRRPQLVVQAAGTLDRLSDGRLILGLGAGEDQPDFEAFGDPFDRATRIGLMDEALAIVDAGLRGVPLDHGGPLLTARGVVLGPVARPAAAPAHLAGCHASRAACAGPPAGRAGSGSP